jgi:hypothetical protein
VRKQVQSNTTATIRDVRAALEKRLTLLNCMRCLSPGARGAGHGAAAEGRGQHSAGLAPVVCAGTRECA